MYTSIQGQFVLIDACRTSEELRAISPNSVPLFILDTSLFRMACVNSSVFWSLRRRFINFSGRVKGSSPIMMQNCGNCTSTIFWLSCVLVRSRITLSGTFEDKLSLLPTWLLLGKRPRPPTRIFNGSPSTWFLLTYHCIFLMKLEMPIL